MLYFDTSFLVPLILAEDTSVAVAKFFRDVDTDKLTTSHLARLEFVSMIARVVRMGRLRSDAAQEAEVTFENLMARSFLVILPTADDYEAARKMLGQYDSGLRAGDALHLAIALNHGAQSLYSLDKRMIAIGSALDLTMNDGLALDGYNN